MGTLIKLPSELLSGLKTITTEELPESNKGKTKWSQEQLKSNRLPERIKPLRPFIAWDGEGVTVPGSKVHNYILFGSSAKNQVPIQSPNAETNLATYDCFNTMLQCADENPNAIHVGFYFNYDVEMMTKDIPVEKMQRLYDTNWLKWKIYNINYVQSKWLQVTGTIPDPKRGSRKVTAKIWDVSGFFQTSFVRALSEYLPSDTPGLSEVIAGKAKRSVFSFDELETLIKPYWVIEERLLVELMDVLRSHLHTADLRINNWHGPGAIANYLYARHKTAKAMCRELPDSVTYQSQRAFAGGRFEAWRVGRINQPVYVYDINSAYPAGMVSLPPLTGRWHHVDYPGQISRFGVYNIGYDRAEQLGMNDDMSDESFNQIFSQAMREPHPFMYRDKNANVFFPSLIPFGTHIWQPELLAAQASGHDYVLASGWELEHTDERPFDWVQEMYDKRQEWKAAGHQAQWALKLGLNSLFGKTAQRVGWKVEGDQIPKWHQIEWAGFITSTARAKLWSAIWQAWEKGGLISCDTDAVISTVPLDLPISTNLGDWDFEEYEDMIYFQNGVYFTKRRGEWKWKFRGLDDDSLTLDDAIAFCNNTYPATATPEDMTITGTTSRFIGGKDAIHRNALDEWRTWDKKPHQVHIGTTGKRIHLKNFCIECEYGLSLGDAMHTMVSNDPESVEHLPSQPHFIPWKVEPGAEWRDPLAQEHTPLCDPSPSL